MKIIINNTIALSLIMILICSHAYFKAKTKAVKKIYLYIILAMLIIIALESVIRYVSIAFPIIIVLALLFAIASKR